ncbi:hypothetical protein H4R18_001996 [Coemansia javaensis]|uniref:TOM13-domain-containing protein n=1 Tax=Coemansia javaensis TaxID=2761396 RepID=A0A9W8HE53_9FUNG|nr:hypothetical protein H4R18_001996 [Coemansia javaensis]
MAGEAGPAALIDSGICEGDMEADGDSKTAKTMVSAPGVRSRWFAPLSGWGGAARFLATYVALPFVTGVMAGMGEIFANELMYRWGWRGARPVAVPGRNGQTFPAAKKE